MKKFKQALLSLASIAVLGLPMVGSAFAVESEPTPDLNEVLKHVLVSLEQTHGLKCEAGTEPGRLPNALICGANAAVCRGTQRFVCRDLATGDREFVVKAVYIYTPGAVDIRKVSIKDVSREK